MKLKQYRCTNIKCRKPLLFEGDFIGTIEKKCPKCKEIIIFKEKEKSDPEKIIDKICS